MEINFENENWYLTILTEKDNKMTTIFMSKTDIHGEIEFRNLQANEYGELKKVIKKNELFLQKEDNFEKYYMIRFIPVAEQIFSIIDLQPVNQN